MSDPSFCVAVAGVERQTADVLSFELRAADGGDLPAFEAGAHIDVATPAGLRQYSLCNPPGERARYLIAVKRELAGRGGSRWMHEQVRPGRPLTISAPRNAFRLSETASHHCLVAGGIGITPLLSMAAHLWARGASFELLCFARGAAWLPMRGLIEAAPWRARVRCHFDEDPPARPLLDGAARLPGSHVYLCGPQAFMDHVRGQLSHVPADAIHQELFGAPALPAAPVAGAADGAFTVQLARSGRAVPVAAGQSILQALRAAGLDPLSSCESGVCGACVTPYLDGEPDHRDYCLSPAERATSLALCCARARTERLVLDL